MLLSERDYFTTHLFRIDFLFVLFDWISCVRIAKIVFLLLYLHSEQASDLNILNNLAGQIILIVGCLWQKLSNQPLVVFSDQTTEMLFNSYSSGIHNLKSFDTHL